MPNHQQKKHKYRNQGDLYKKKKKSLFTVKVYLYIKTAKIKLKKMFQMLQCLSKKHLTHQTAVLRTRI